MDARDAGVGRETPQHVAGQEHPGGAGDQQRDAMAPGRLVAGRHQSENSSVRRVAMAAAEGRRGASRPLAAAPAPAATLPAAIAAAWRSAAGAAGAPAAIGADGSTWPSGSVVRGLPMRPDTARAPAAASNASSAGRVDDARRERRERPKPGAGRGAPRKSIHPMALRIR